MNSHRTIPHGPFDGLRTAVLVIGLTLGQGGASAAGPDPAPVSTNRNAAVLTATAIQTVKELLSEPGAMRVNRSVKLPVTFPDEDVQFALPARHAALRGTSRTGRAADAVGATAGRSRTLDALRSCKEARLGPEIGRIGTIMPGRPFVIEGICFGDSLGRVALAGGPGAGGRISFTQWTDTRIEGVLERMRGVADGNIELSLISGAGERATPRMARFRAEREVVQVPPRRWAPNGQMSWATSDLPEPPKPNVWPDVSWDSPRPKLPQSFTLRLTGSCRLLAVGIDGEGFNVTSEMTIQPNATGDEATLEIGLQVVDLVRFSGMVDGLRTADRFLQRGHYVIQADASCPVGIAP